MLNATEHKRNRIQMSLYRSCICIILSMIRLFHVLDCVVVIVMFLNVNKRYVFHPQLILNIHFNK